MDNYMSLCQVQRYQYRKTKQKMLLRIINNKYYIVAYFCQFISKVYFMLYKALSDILYRKV